MHYVFYDFETSGTDLLDQILSFAFVITDEDYQEEDRLIGTIKLNKTQWPNPQAILTNKLNLDTLDASGYPEWVAAEHIHTFLNNQIQKHTQITLIGYNSSHFDWEFLKNIFIRYGLSPYFMGRISHIDLLYVVRQCYFEHHNTFTLPLKRSQSGQMHVSMTLEAVSETLKLRTQKQSHEALDDVQLCIQLCENLTRNWKASLTPSHYHNLAQCAPFKLYRQKTLHFAEKGTEPEPYSWKYWMPITQEKNGGLALDLEKWISQGYTTPETAIKYTNQTRHEMRLEEVDTNDTPDIYTEAYTSALAIPEIKTLTIAQHFEAPLDWDIAYQLHALGFKRIDTLRHYILQLIKNPDTHVETVKQLWAARKDIKDTYLIQLLNRAYLNIHPNPKKEHYMRYIRARYMTGTMYRNPSDVPNLAEDLVWAEAEKETADNDLHPVLAALCNHYYHFLGEFEVGP
jgi:DNA polymerase III epsilon subunit-like protein